MADDERALNALRDAIDAFGEELAPEVVARARAEAVARASSILAEAMAHSLLDHARPLVAHEPLDEPEPSDDPEPAPPGGAERDDIELAHYVYGVARAGAGALPEGLEGTIGIAGDHPVAIEHRGLVAIVGLVPLDEFGEEALRENLNDVGWLEAKARAHEGVLDATLSAMTVVPMRLCTIYRSEQQVKEMLERERGVFHDALARLDGKTEWGVKMIAEEGALERALSGQDADARSEDLSPGAAYMRDRSRQAQARDKADRIAADWAEQVHAHAATHAVEALLNPVQNPEVSGHTGEMVLNGVYLVADKDSDVFRGEVERLAEEFADLGVAVELTGPWPPYNFVKGSIEAAR